jgi:hypothetical protein
MRVLRIICSLPDKTVKSLPRGKYPLDVDSDFFYLVDYSGFDFNLGEEICATYTPDGKLFCVCKIKITYISMGWNDQQDQIFKYHKYGCGFKFYDQSYTVINNYLPLESQFKPPKYLYFLDKQSVIPDSIPVGYEEIEKQ